jgi:PEP-CTERM motif
MSFHPRQALAAACLLTVSVHSLATVLQGTTFGATAEAGGVKAGGWYQSSAEASHGSNSENTEARAWGDSESFAVHAYAWTSENPTLPAYCTVYTCSWQTYATVSVWDTVTITPSAGSTETLPYKFSIDGIKKRGPWAYGDGASAQSSYYIGTSSNGWYAPTTRSLSTGRVEVAGSVQARDGQPITLYVFGELSVSARSGGMADYSHTMSFHWDLPQGWTYTSASGHFSPAPVPEPTSMALMVCGLMGLTLLHRRRGNAGR